ncbi:MAG: FAD-dependent oxidoreductase [Planctomycetota bacterium]
MSRRTVTKAILATATGKSKVLLGTTFHRARVSGKTVTAVEAWFPGKHLTIEADLFVDCTADGNLATDAGCEFHLGQDARSVYNEPSAPQIAQMQLNSCTLLYRVTNTGKVLKTALPQGIKEGICPRPVCIRILPNGDHLINPLDMIEGNALLHNDYSRLMRDGLHRAIEHFHWLQNQEPQQRNHIAGPMGYKTWTLVGIAPRIGVRESRRILGDYILTEQDCLAGLKNQQHNDIITITDHAVDIHGTNSRLYEVPNGPYGVPYRCLTPRGVENLFIASRAASFSHIAASSCRLSRTIMTIGQAAGTAAAMAVKHHLTTRQVDIRELQASMQAQGVDITTG